MPTPQKDSGPQKRLQNGFIISIGDAYVRTSVAEEFFLFENHVFRKRTYFSPYFIHPVIHLISTKDVLHVRNYDHDWT